MSDLIGKLLHLYPNAEVIDFGINRTKVGTLFISGRWNTSKLGTKPTQATIDAVSPTDAAAADLAYRQKAVRENLKSAYTQEADELFMNWQWDKENNRANQNESRQAWLDKRAEIKSRPELQVPTE